LLRISGLVFCYALPGNSFDGGKKVSLPVRVRFFLGVLFVFVCALQLPRLSAQQVDPVPPQQPPAAAQQPAPSVPLSTTVFATANDVDYSENFSDLTLRTSALFPLKPVMGQRDDNPKMPFVRERWQMMWRPADSFDLYVCKPREATGRLPVILYLYTYPSSTDRFKSDDWCKTMTSDGFIAAGFLSAYTGDRMYMRSPTTSFFTNFQETLGATVHDVQMILDYLATRDDIDMSRVGMYGQGSGGTIAILASTVDPRIKALDVLTPWADWPSFFAQSRYVAADKRAIFMAPEYQKKIAGLEPLKLLPKVKAKSLRIQDVRKSGPMPDKSQVGLEAVAPRTAIINQYGDPEALAPHTMGGALFGWLRAQLQPDAKPQVALAKAKRIHYYPPAAVNPLPPLTPLKKPETNN
jgi:hypothetical protein